MELKELDGKCVVFLAALFLVAWFAVQPVLGESGIYDRIGIIPEHGLHGAVPEENIDLFTGNLTLRFKDIVLKAPDDFDLVIWRVYNSKIWKDHQLLEGSPMQQEPYSWVGIGWTMHQGRIHIDNSSEPVIEFPDGRWETAYQSIDNPQKYITRDFLVYNQLEKKLYFPDGTVWTFGEARTIHYDMTYSSDVLQVTEITNPHGRKIQIFYRQAFPIIDRIIDSLGREVDFITDDTIPAHPRLKEIKVKNSDGQWVSYSYSVNRFESTNYHRLDSYDSPEIPASTYQYNDFNSSASYTLKKLTTSFGGAMEYEYEDHEFYFFSSTLYTQVVKRKTIRFTSSSVAETWQYTYPTYENETGVVSVDGPVFDSQFTFYGYPPSPAAENGWKIGLLKAISYSDGSYAETWEWNYTQISNYYWEIMQQNFGRIRAPLINKIITTRNGDAESQEEYFYERDCAQYGLPTRIKYYGGASGTTLKNYKTLEYYFEDNSTFADKYMVLFVKEETHYDSSGTKLKETLTDYYNNPTIDNFGRIKEIKRLKEGGSYLTWSYSFDITGAYDENVTVYIDLPGGRGQETYKYNYGTLAEIRRPGFIELTRTISSYTGSVKTETNQHGGTMSFAYDDLDRIVHIYMPSGFNRIDVNWSTDSVGISQGTNTVIKYWDGLGRDTGYIEIGDGGDLYYSKILDAEGRVTAESKGSTSESPRYIYVLNAAGSPTRMTDPLGKITNISYSADQKTVTDANSKQSIFIYEDLPGLVSRMTDAAGKTAEYTYDGAGRLTTVEYDNSRNQSYSYNGLDQVTSESHPETDTISYTYNTEGNLSARTWGGVSQTYTYNSSNQLTVLDAGDETITNTYDFQGRINKVSGSKGWSRDQIEYNSLGSITNERHYIPGMPISSYKLLQYTYDANNNLKSIIYPDGKRVEYTNNGLNMPETVSFNYKTLVGAVSYSIGKQPAAVTISGSGTDFYASYKSTGYLEETGLRKGSTHYYRSGYTYDGVGNIISIDDETANNFDASFSYDDLYRLTSAAYTGGKSYNYTYDYYGNMLTAKENGITIFNKTYTTQNRVSGYNYDDRGNLQQNESYSYSWDNQERLTEIKNYPTAETTGVFSCNERGLRYKAGRMPPPGIFVTSPQAAEEWFTGGTYSITWLITGAMDDVVKIALFSQDGRTQIAEIDAVAPNNGSFQWTVPENISANNYIIRVETVDGQNKDESDIFLIKKPSLTVTSPAAGSEWVKGIAYPILWDKLGPMNDYVKISLYSADGSTLIKSITVNTLNNGFFNWTVNNDINTGQYIIRIETIDGKIYDDSDVFVIFDRLIRVASPAAGAVWVHNETYTISWEVSDPVTENVDISLYKNYIKILDIASNHPNNQPYNWLIPASITPGDNVFTIRVETIDGQVGDDSGVFSISAGYIAVTAPAPGETLSYGQHYTIHWEKHGAINEYVKINLYKGAVHISVITAGTLNSTGSFTWEVPYGLEVGDDYKIQVKTLDDLFFGDSGQFGIEEFVLFTKIMEGPLVNDGAVSYHPRWFDYNLDGYLDLFVTNYSKNMLFTNYGDGVFEDDTEIIENNVGNSEAVACGDIDNDGYTDLAAGATSYSYLYNNINGESFTEIGEQAGINYNHHSEGFNMIDYNNDGLLDLFMTLSYNGQVSKLYRNNGNKTFTDIASSFMPLLSAEGSSWGDYDNDGDLDLIILTSAYNKNAFFENNGDGSFQQITNSDFIIVNDDEVLSIAADWGDYNNDGFLDLFVANYGAPGFLYRNNGDKTFTKILTGPTATDSASSLDCEWFDIDNDGRLDLLVSNFSGLNFVYRNKDGDTFERWNNIGIDNDAYYTWGCSAADYDNDGDLDVYYACYGGKNNLLFRNNIGTRENNWLSITCQGVQANASAIGAVVRVKAEIDGESIWQMRQITDRDATRASFGLGDAPIIDKIKIEWPTNPTKVQILKHIDINRFLTITESSDKKIFVKSPNGGENWNAGTTHDITWSTMSLISDPVGNIKIKYSTDGGNSWTTIASDLPENGSFSWVVPNNISDNCLVRVGEMDASPVDTSDAPFAICLPSSFAVTSPNGGEEWQTGSKQNITWDCSSVFDRVRIDYSLDDGLTWLEIVDFTPNDGSYEWSIPNTPSTRCLVRIRGGDTDQDPPDTSDAPFSITSPQTDSLKVIAPNGGETLIANTYYEIGWSSAGVVGDLKLEYSTNNGSTWTEITAATPDDGSFEWQIPDEPSAYCLVRISDPIEQISDVSDDVFTIAANTGPTISVISPNGGESFPAGSHQVVAWTSTQYTGPVRIEYTGDGGETWKLIAASIPNNNSFEWTVPDAPADNCLVRISAADSDRSPMDVSDAPFSITLAQPAITVTNPEGGETFHIGDEVSIDWETVGIAGNIEILLRKYDDTEGYTIAGDRPYDGSPYSYVIPGSVVPGSYFIRVQQGAIVGESPLFSIADAIPTSITVSSPQAGERYYGGVTHIIVWTRTEDIADTAVKIDLYDAAGTNLITNIETSTVNDGFYKWAVAPDIQPGDYTIKVQAIDGTVSGMSQVFSVNDNIPLTLTGPRRGREWYRGISHRVTWYRDEAIAGVNVSLYLYDEAGETLVQAIAHGIENAGSFAWLVDEGILDGNYIIRIETIDGLNAHNGEVFSIGQPGDLVVIEPYECEEWLAGETYNIKWYRHDSIVGKDIELDLYDVAGEKKVGDIAVTLNDGGFELVIDADIASGDYTIRARTVDRVDEDFSDVFTILLSQVSEGACAAGLVAEGCDNSENNTKIGYDGGMESSDYYADAGYHDKRHGPYSGDDSIEANERAAGTTNPSPLTINKTLSAGMIDTYYIWSYDGRLLAEYDQNGNCVKDYIYLGNKLLAEYHPQTGKYYYHTQDQVGTTRIVTDDDGNVVYSAVHGPYGDMQKEWVNTYKPTQKFSGKEREAYSEMDYFGARYFDHISYRFVSVDPVRNRDEAIANPQLWNLYAYCNNNPITYLDPDGKDHIVSEDFERYVKEYREDFNNAIKQARLNALIMTAEIAASFLMEGTFAQGPSSLRLKKSKFKIHFGRQAKHIPGNNNFMPGRSEFTHHNVQSIVDKFAGKGEPIGKTPRGKPGFRERVDFGEPIGTYVDENTGERLKTTIGIIHYSKEGVHIVPARPN